VVKLKARMNRSNPKLNYNIAPLLCFIDMLDQKFGGTSVGSAHRIKEVA
jgi:hypothetical protein